ncbi:MAG: glycosyltransferase [Phycisphaera sp.]|nr:glycosyltransferase [Phycisphaera sp.]
MRVVHLITTLAVGGAEQMLVKLLRAMDRSEFEPTVVTLVDDGPLREVIRSLGIEVLSLDLRRGEVSPRALSRLVRILRATRPDLVQSWMYHANAAAMLARPWLPRRTGVVWNIRQSLYDISRERYLTQAVIRSGRLLAPYADAIVNNSRVSRSQHARIGYLNQRSLVIPNGFEVERFKPDAAARASLRAELGVGGGRVLVGMAARVHPQKDHGGFLAAAADAAARDPRLEFLLAGRGTTTDDGIVAAARGALRGRLHLLGEREDMPRIVAALDVAVSSSGWGEGCPNSVGEAMSAGVPVVGTDVGDTADVIGACGRIVPPKDPSALAEGVLALASLAPHERAQLAEDARARIRAHFSIPFVAARYARLYREIAAERRGGGMPVFAASPLEPTDADVPAEAAVGR